VCGITGAWRGLKSLKKRWPPRWIRRSSAEIAGAVRSAGFPYVAVDCDGYRSGSMNELLPAEMLSGNMRNGEREAFAKTSSMKIGND
jgi:hypothetical protein